jgi:hypothetical protein
MSRKILLAASAIALSGMILGSDLQGQGKERLQRWEYTVLRHSPHLREGGSDLKRLQSLGKEGWEVASSYPAKGEIVVSILKRKR